MADQFKVYYVAEFPLDRITDAGEEGWYAMPQHLRHQYHFLDAVLEHIDNTACEPVQVTMRADGTVVVGPSGVTRLYALRTQRGWTAIPAIVSTTTEPDWLDTSVPVTNVAQFASYYRLTPASLGFEDNGKAFHRNHNPNPAQVIETLVVTEETKARVLAMLEEEAKR